LNKLSVMKKILPGLFILAALQADAQNISGYWYGVANPQTSDKTNNYLVEMIVNHDAKGNVKGIMNYYFKNTFRSVTVKGNYKQSSRVLTIDNVPLPFHASKSSSMSIDCIMDMAGIVKFAKAGSDIAGSFISIPQYQYTCPQLTFTMKLNASISKKDSIITALNNFKETNQVWSPTVNDTLVAVNIIPRKVENIVIANLFKEREKLVIQEIEVESDSLKIDIYDNGVVDGDSISVFYNDKLIAFNRVLSTKAIHINLNLDPQKEVSELSMFADNLGSIPPNTALMVVSDGKTRYEIRMSSSFNANGTVRIKRKSPLKPSASAERH
jgi:hypothetical protein